MTVPKDSKPSTKSASRTSLGDNGPSHDSVLQDRLTCVTMQISEIRFLGVWYTVAAYGLPMDEMTRGVSLFIWPLELPDDAVSGGAWRLLVAQSTHG